MLTTVVILVAFLTCVFVWSMIGVGLVIDVTAWALSKGFTGQREVQRGYARRAGHIAWERGIGVNSDTVYGYDADRRIVAVILPGRDVIKL
jgi:hypothetical protein